MSKITDLVSGILASREQVEKVKLSQIPKGEILTEEAYVFSLVCSLLYFFKNYVKIRIKVM